MQYDTLAAPVCASLALMCLGGQALCQDVRWNLGSRDAALYERTYELRVIEPEEGGPDHWRPRLVREHNPPLVLGSSLAADGRSCRTEIPGVRMIASAVAFDLRRAGHGGALRMLIPQNNELRTTRLKLEYGREARDGTQRIRGRLEPEPDGDVDVWTVDGQATIRGTLDITRRIDRGAGNVAGFESVLALSWIDHREGVRAQLELCETWTLSEIVHADDATVRERAGRAVSGARDALLAELRRTDSSLWRSPTATDFDRLWTSQAELAEVVRTLLELGVDPGEPALATALRILRSTEPAGDFARCAAIRAIAQSTRPPGERQELAIGVRPRPDVRPAIDDDRALLARWTQGVIDAMGSEAPDGIVWRVPGSPTETDVDRALDAVRALDAARLAGVVVPVEVWKRAARHWLATARPAADGVAVSLRIVAPDGQVGQGSIVPLGWPTWGGRDCDGTTTAAALDALVRCRDALDAAGAREAQAVDEVEQGIDGALAWLQEHWTPLYNPGPPFYFASYRAAWFERLAAGLERAQIRILGDRDWYFEVALVGIGLQYPDGASWAGVHDTCRMLRVLRGELPGPATGRR
ncbi:MAG: hypothetical protein IPM29_28990 [Planctomycetes bacterium]|nr:hypothetical protein [Planctomycetota bacterium]